MESPMDVDMGLGNGMVDYTMDDANAQVSNGSVSVMNPYGFVDIESIEAVQPNDGQFLHDSPLISMCTSHFPNVLSPLPSYTPPPGCTFPQSPKWFKVPDPSYAVGFCYKASISSLPEKIQQERDAQMNITVPPGIDPVWDVENNCYTYPKVRGCVTPPASCPLRLDVDKDAGSVTFATYHTPASLKELYPAIWLEMLPLANELYHLVFGVCATSPNKVDVIPIYAYERLKKNNRSSDSGTRVVVMAGRDNSYNGSYSLASTVEKIGSGVIKPVSQLAEDDFQSQLLKIIRILKRFYQLIVPLSISVLEWELTKFQLEDNNVFTAGGLDIGPVAIQMNVSDTWIEGGENLAAGEGNLAKEIGHGQGSIHGDSKDAITLFTLLSILLRLPEGAVGGSLLLACYGVHLPFEDAWLLNIVFDARNLHGARNVCIHPEILKLQGQALMLNAQNYQSDSEYQGMERLWHVAGRTKCVAFVQYFPHAAIYRTGNYSLAPSVDFGNTGTLTRAEAKVRTFAGSGEIILGPALDVKSRMAREAAYAFLNTLTQCGLRTNFTAKDILSQIQFRDTHTNCWMNVELPELNALDPEDAPKVQKLRSYLAYYYHLRKSLLLNIDNVEFFSHQAKLLEKLKDDSQYKPTKPSNFCQGISLRPEHSSKGKSVRIILPSGNGHSLVAGSSQQLCSSDTARTSESGVMPAMNIDSLSPNINSADSGEISGKKSKKRKKPEELEERGAVGVPLYIGNHTYRDYEVEGIVDHEFTKRSYLFLLKFKGWPVAPDVDWYNESDLVQCQEMLCAYLEHHRLTLLMSDFPESNFTLLENLFKQDNLDLQYSKLKENCRSLPKGCQTFNVQNNFQKLISTYMSVNKRQFTLTNLIRLEPLQNSSLSLDSLQDQSRTIGWLFERVSTAFEVLPQLKQSTYMLQIWEASVQWQHCRVILIIHDFITRALPELLELLFQTHRLNPTFLLKNYSAYGVLVNNIMQFLVDYAAQYSRKQGPRSTSYFTAPSNLFGIVNNVELLDLKFQLKNKRIESGKIYSVGKEIFLDVIISQLVMPKLQGIDSAALTSERKKNRKKKGPKKKQEHKEESEEEREERRKEKQEELLDEYLLIWIRSYMGHSIHYGNPGIQRRALLKPFVRTRINVWGIFVPLTVKNLAHDFGLEVHRSVMEYICGKSLSNAAYEGTVITNHFSPSQRRIDDPRMLLLSDIVQTGKESISFGILGLIVREAVREYTGEDYALQSLHWYLEGKDSTDGTVHVDGDRDQWDPIREANIGALLLQTHLPCSKLTGKIGLANLLCWHGTGQGNMTLAFLDHITKSPSQRFFSPSLERLMQLFTRAQHINDSIIAHHPEVDMAIGQEALPFSIAGFMRLSNCRIYGTASNLLKLLPTSKTSNSWMRTIPSKSSFGAHLKEKFEPYWAPSIEAAWRAFLGDFFDQDPRTYTGKRHTWTEGIDFIDALKIPGFRKSLTAMQLANALMKWPTGFGIIQVLVEKRIPAMGAWALDAEQKDQWFTGTSEFAFPLTTPKGFVQQILDRIQNTANTMDTSD
ncbi:hypothetical protein BT96DRAFT_980529 [Gymnopus androsaceus JB14]|uniref:Chromo domain-containing protein n=1 Tax=Gymnopus androsaceus JB14 TaxID=1447944 RepID=A0A6A4GVP2_9AGAR|nr:hypothetical protein BT96DRAFT_980529 [Gymnopus androsaceus JB14]